MSLLKLEKEVEIDPLAFMFEPLTMSLWGTDVETREYVHPHIQEIVDSKCTPCELNQDLGYFDGPVLRFSVQSKTLHLESAILLEQPAYDFIQEHCFNGEQSPITEQIIDAMNLWFELICTGDCYGFQEGQFMVLYPEEYQLLGKLFNEGYKFSFSPDIGLRKDSETEWGFCT